VVFELDATDKKNDGENWKGGGETGDV